MTLSFWRLNFPRRVSTTAKPPALSAFLSSASRLSARSAFVSLGCVLACDTMLQLHLGTANRKAGNLRYSLKRRIVAAFASVFANIVCSLCTYHDES